MSFSSLNLFLVITLVTVLVLIVEIVFSFSKKDGVYSSPGTAGNLFRGILMTLLSNKVTTFYFTYFGILYPILGYDHKGLNLYSFFMCLFAVDFFYYILHLIKHRFCFFWTFHSVHHSDNKFNMSTYYRASWIEHLYMPAIPLFLAILMGFNPQTIFLVSYSLFIYQFYCHSRYIKFPTIMEYIFITPQTHIVHHDQEIKHQNSNFGAMFSIWDRMFGTYTGRVYAITPGIKKYEQNNFIKMESDPIVKYLESKFGDI